MQVVLYKSLLVPLTCLFQVIDLLLFFLDVVFYELLKVLVAACLSHDHTSFVNFHKDLLGSKQVVSIAEASHGEGALHLSQVIANHFIDKVTLDSPIVGARANIECLDVSLDDGRLDPGLLL